MHRPAPVLIKLDIFPSASSLQPYLHPELKVPVVQASLVPDPPSHPFQCLRMLSSGGSVEGSQLVALVTEAGGGPQAGTQRNAGRRRAGNSAQLLLCANLWGLSSLMETCCSSTGLLPLLLPAGPETGYCCLHLAL